MGRPRCQPPHSGSKLRYCLFLGAGDEVSSLPLGSLLPVAPVVPVMPEPLPLPLPDILEALLLALDICCAPVTKFCGFAIRSFRTSGCVLR